MPTAASSQITVDLDALVHNLAGLRRAVGSAEVAPAVKADSYGLGSAEVGRRLWAEGVRSFFVARLDEGVALRKALGAKRPATIYLLDGPAPGANPELLKHGLTPCLNSLEQIEAWSGEARAREQRLRAAVHIDTGMNRLGLRPEQAAGLADRPELLDGVEVCLVMSHLACASQPDHPMNGRQLQAFHRVRGLFPAAKASLANSGGCFLRPDYAFDLVRPGISLYGGGPFERADDRLKAVARFEAPILQVRDVVPGDTVGYDAAFVVERPMKLAVVAAGYADGVLRGFSPLGKGWYAGAARPVVGLVSMDVVMFDITGCEQARAGETIELIGPNMPLNETAVASGTSAYECLVRLSDRARRIVVGRAA